MYPAIIIGTVRSLIVDVAMGQIPRSTERISSIVNIIITEWTGRPEKRLADQTGKSESKYSYKHTRLQD